MATVKNRSTLGIRYNDANQKEKTFNIGYVNPENSDAVNKTLAEKFMDLTEFGKSNISQIYTTDITNITDSSTDTAIIATISSNSDFLSSDTTTFQAAFDTAGNEGTIYLDINQNGTYSYFNFTAGTLKNAQNVSNMAKLIEAKTINLYGESVFPLAEFKGSNHKLIVTPGLKTITEIQFRSNSGATAAMIKSIGENLLSTSGDRYTITYTDATEQRLRITFNTLG